MIQCLNNLAAPMFVRRLPAPYHLTTVTHSFMGRLWFAATIFAHTFTDFVSSSCTMEASNNSLKSGGGCSNSCLMKYSTLLAGTQIRSGLLHYSSQRSVVRRFSIDARNADVNLKLRNPNAQSFTHAELQKAMLETISSINQFGEEAGVNEVCWNRNLHSLDFKPRNHSQPSLMNFCVTDGVSIVATRYVSSRNDAAASLVCTPFLLLM